MDWGLTNTKKGVTIQPVMKTYLFASCIYSYISRKYCSPSI